MPKTTKPTKAKSSSSKPAPPGDAEYWFDEDAAERAVLFFEQCLTHVKGEFAGKPFTLDPWQRDEIIRPVFGWKRRDGTRKYRVLYVEIPRKQGKSTICAGIALYLMCADREPGSEVYSAAADREQAAIVFDAAKQMVVQSDMLRPRLEVYRRSMAHMPSASSYKVISADAYTKHGFNAHGIVVDELHAQKNRDLVDVLKTSTGARRQPLEVYITTAGYDKNSICWEMHEYALRVRDGLTDDPSFLPVIYAAEADDDWRDPKTWAKANPGLGVSVSHDYFERECKRAQEIAGYENTFKRLHLNMWTQQDTRWLQVEQVWDPCATPVDWPSLKGRRAWAGIDLSTTTDLTALVFLVEDPNDDVFDVVPFFWVPRENVRKRIERDRAPYDVFIREGALLTTEGNVVDYEAVRLKVNEVAEHLRVVELPIDRWNSTQLQTQLQGDGFTVVPFGQGFASMSAPTKELERLLMNCRIRHGGHPVLRWMASNVAVSQDPAGNMKPDKSKSTERIDGIVALIMAIGRMSATPPDNEPSYQVLFLG